MNSMENNLARCRWTPVLTLFEVGSFEKRSE